MKNRARKFSCTAFLCAVLCVLAVIPASAAIDPPMPDGGSVPGGVFVLDGQSELALEQAELRFDIPELPLEKYTSEQEFLAYGAQVTATYTLNNPTDHEVSEQLMTPIGIYPDAARELPEGLDAYKYTVAIDGSQINTQVRHAYTVNRNYYNHGVSLSQTYGPGDLSDDFVQHPILSPDAIVYVYDYQATLYSDNTKNGSYQLAGKLHADPDTCSIFTLGFGYPSKQQGDILAYDFFVFRDESFSICSVGTDVGEVAFFAHDYDNNPVNASVTLTSKTTMTFYEYVMQGYNAQSGVSERDYYNAFVAYAEDYKTEGTAATFLGDTAALSSQHVQPWHTFYVTLAPGQRITVTLTAPLYPAIHTEYDPPVYTYPFAMTDSASWSSCGQTRVQVITEHFLNHKGVSTPNEKTYTQTEDGYVWEGQADFPYLVFSVCMKENPQNTSLWLLLAATAFILVVLFVIYVLPGVIVAAGIVLVIVLIVRKNRKKKREKEKAHSESPTENAHKEAHDDAKTE